MKYFLNAAWLPFFLFVLAPWAALAHPHVWVDASLAFSVSDDGLDHVRETWLFDEMFTQAVLGDLNLTPHTLETTLGQEKIRAGAFDFLANYGYFTFIEADGQRISVDHVEGFEAHVFDGRLVYGFTVPIHRPFSELSGFRMAVFDKEYYADVQLMKSAIGFEVAGMNAISHSVQPARDLAYWQFIVPDAVHLSLAGPSGRTAPMPSVDREADSNGIFVDGMTRVRAVQKALTLRLNRFGMEIQDNPLGGALWMFLGLAFVYGVVHAIGPGHGKGVVCSYFMSNPGSFFSALLMGNAITFVHMLSAVLVVGGTYLVVETGMGGFQRASNVVQPVSYGLLMAMGVFLTVSAIRKILRGEAVPVGACESVGSRATGNELRRMLSVAFVTGLVPCPGAAVILSFSIGLNILWAGVFAVVAMAVGMGVTTSAFGFLALGARTVALGASRRHRVTLSILYSILSIGGALAITGLGALFFYGSLGSRWPGM